MAIYSIDMKKAFKKLLIIVFIVTSLPLLYGGITYSVRREAALKGTVLDNSTGLIWMRCSVIGYASGYTMTDSTDNCESTSETMVWEDALQACNSSTLGGLAWRLPNIRELHSIVTYYNNQFPRINNSAFPNTVRDHYWSSTTYANAVDNAWFVDFNFGNAGMNKKTRQKYVRCVSGP